MEQNRVVSKYFLINNSKSDNQELEISVSGRVSDDDKHVTIMDGFYILTNKDIFDAGTIIQANMNVLKSLDTTHTFKDHVCIKDHITMLEKREARFLLKFPINMRLKMHNGKEFKIIQDLEIGQEINLRREKFLLNSYEITGRTIESDCITFDLKDKNSPTIISGVDASEIKLAKPKRKMSIRQEIKLDEPLIPPVTNNISKPTGLKLRNKPEISYPFDFRHLDHMGLNTQFQILDKKPDDCPETSVMEKSPNLIDLNSISKSIIPQNSPLSVDRLVSISDGSPNSQSTAIPANFIYENLWNCSPDNANAAQKRNEDFLEDAIRVDSYNSNSDGEKLHFIIDNIVDTTKIFSVKSTNNCQTNDINLGNPVTIQINANNHIGEVKWIGIINNEKCVGLDMEDKFEYGLDGIIRNDIGFDCLKGHGLITPLTNIKLYKTSNKPPLLVCGLINPNKYFKCEESWNVKCVEERNLKKDNVVFVTMKMRNEEMKLKGILRWCGKMSQSFVGAVELNQDHEYGTDGMFWRSQLFKCPSKRAIGVPLNNVYQYFPYEQKEVPMADRIFPEIDINSAVKFYFELNNNVGHFVVHFGTVKWIGVDEYGEYFYGLELEERITDGTDGEFSGQRLFQCRPGHGKLVSMDDITRDTRSKGKGLTELENPNNHEPEILPIENISHLIESGDIQSIRLLLDNCDLTSIPSLNFLKVASLALKNNDDDLFNLAIENCEDRNTLLENGETFLTNLLKENHSEERIVNIIQKNNFDLHVNNEKNESPFILACKMGMASVVEKIIPRSLSTIQRQDATKLALDAQDNIELLGRRSVDILKICTLINRVPADQAMDCTICMDKIINIVLECGHVCCETCSKELSKCPYCDQHVGTIKRIYLP